MRGRDAAAGFAGIYGCGSIAAWFLNPLPYAIGIPLMALVMLGGGMVALFVSMCFGDDKP